MFLQQFSHQYEKKVTLSFLVKSVYQRKGKELSKINVQLKNRTYIYLCIFVYNLQRYMHQFSSVQLLSHVRLFATP